MLIAEVISPQSTRRPTAEGPSSSDDRPFQIAQVASEARRLRLQLDRMGKKTSRTRHMTDSEAMVMDMAVFRYNQLLSKLRDLRGVVLPPTG